MMADTITDGEFVSIGAANGFSYWVNPAGVIFVRLADGYYPVKGISKPATAADRDAVLAGQRKEWEHAGNVSLDTTKGGGKTPPKKSDGVKTGGLTATLAASPNLQWWIVGGIALVYFVIQKRKRK